LGGKQGERGVKNSLKGTLVASATDNNGQ
jgi:hypothetical protein